MQLFFTSKPSFYLFVYTGRQQITVTLTHHITLLSVILKVFISCLKGEFCVFLFISYLISTNSNLNWYLTEVKCRDVPFRYKSSSLLVSLCYYRLCLVSPKRPADAFVSLVGNILNSTLRWADNSHITTILCWSFCGSRLFEI